MKNIDLKATDKAVPEVDTGLLIGWLNRTDLARELTLSVDTLQRWETRRMGPPCVRVGRKVLYRMEAVRDWLTQHGKKMFCRKLDEALESKAGLIVLCPTGASLPAAWRGGLPAP